MRPRWVVARRELEGVFRERTILLAVIIQVFVAGFSSFLVVGLTALVDPSAFPVDAVPVVATNGTSPFDPYLVDAGVRPLAFASDEDALAAFRRGDADAVLLARPPPDGTVPWKAHLVLPDGDFRATLTLVKVKQGLEKAERDLRTSHEDRLLADPIVLDIPDQAGHFSFVYSLLVPLLALLPVVLAGALVADSLTEEVQRGTLPLLLASPATAHDIVEGKVLANAALVPPLVGAWFLLLAVNHLPVDPLGAVGILVLATAGAVVLALLACAVALLVQDRNRTHVLYAGGLFLLLALTLALPVSPMNAIARLAAGTGGAGAWSVVLGSVVAALLGWAALRLALSRVQGRLASG